MGSGVAGVDGHTSRDVGTGMGDAQACGGNCGRNMLVLGWGKDRDRKVIIYEGGRHM